MKKTDKTGGEWKIAVPVIAVIIAGIVIFSPETSTFKTAGERLLEKEQIQIEREAVLAEMLPEDRAVDTCRKLDGGSANLVPDGKVQVDDNGTNYVVFLPTVDGDRQRCSVSKDGKRIL